VADVSARHGQGTTVVKHETRSNKTPHFVHGGQVRQSRKLKMALSTTQAGDKSPIHSKSPQLGYQSVSDTWGLAKVVRKVEFKLLHISSFVSLVSRLRISRQTFAVPTP
jgi:hypothetical protein